MTRNGMLVAKAIMGLEQCLSEAAFEARCEEIEHLLKFVSPKEAQGLERLFIAVLNQLRP
jgi:hypothetical protein